MTRLVVASGSRHKVAELRDMLRDHDIASLADLPGAPEIAETGATFAANAALKAEGIAAWLRAQGEPGATRVLADDSGICVDALGGAPGVRSARFARDAGESVSGAETTDQANNRRLVAELRRCGVEQSDAHYVCVLAITRVDGAPVVPGGPAVHHVEARWDVEVRTTARGTGGFGYDPHAYLSNGRTVAELSSAEKSTISHRAQALEALQRWLQAAP